MFESVYLKHNENFLIYYNASFESNVCVSFYTFWANEIWILLIVRIIIRHYIYSEKYFKNTRIQGNIFLNERVSVLLKESLSDVIQQWISYYPILSKLIFKIGKESVHDVWVNDIVCLAIWTLLPKVLLSSGILLYFCQRWKLAQLETLRWRMLAFLLALSILRYSTLLKIISPF